MELDSLHLEYKLDLVTHFLGQQYGKENNSNFIADTTLTSNNWYNQ